MRIRLMLLLVVVSVFSVARPGWGETIDEALQVSRSTTVRLDLPGDLPEEFGVFVNLGGVQREIRLTKHSVRSSFFRVLEQRADGLLHETAPPAVSTYRGRVRGEPGSRVTGSLGEGGLTAMLVLEDGTMWHIQPVQEFRVEAERGDHAIYRGRDILPGDWNCGVVSLPRPELVADSGSMFRGGSTTRVTEIAFDADFEFFLLNGGVVANTVVDIEGVLNSVAGIYALEVDIGYLITTIIVRTEEPDPYTSSNNSTLLDEFRDHWNANETGVVRDVAHLMTGKNIEGAVIGTAWLGVICTSPSFSYGFSQSRFTNNFGLRTQLTAHELGHNWNATHCNNDPDCSIMCAFVGGCNGGGIFGQSAHSQITAHLNIASCVGTMADCNSNGIPDDIDITSGVSSDCNGNGMLDECEVFLDCNGNGFFDACDIDSGSSTDCNENSIPDECDIAGGTSFDADGDGIPDECQVVIHVPGDHSTIQAAINASMFGSDVVVDPGTYNEVIDFNGKPVHLRSASGNPADTILDGTGLSDSVVFCISGEGPETILEGFTITGGAGHDDGFGIWGGGMFNDGSSPTVINCVFVGNTAFSGGGMWNNSSNPVVSNCIFAGNTASNGGGMGNFIGNSTVTNCVFTGNTATANGGGMWNINSSPLVTNCTFSGNTTSGAGGGMWSLFSSPTVMNCIFWGDSPNEVFYTGSFIAGYNNMQGGLPGGTTDFGGNIEVNPVFEDADGADNIPGTVDDDLHLSAGSPVTDAGDNMAPGLVGVTTDLDGFLRFYDNEGVTDTGNGVAPFVDMGAFEWQVNFCLVSVGDLDCDGNGVLDSCELVLEVATLMPAGGPGATFPSGVAVGGGVAVLGSPQDGVNGVDAGAAHVYRFDLLTSSWGEEVVLRPSDGGPGNGFGVSAAVGSGGNVVVVGAVFEGTLGVNAGAAYVFRFDSGVGGWVEEAKLLASDGMPGDVFGISLDVSGDAIIVGAEGVDDLGLSSGAAYVFRLDAGVGGWVEEAKLLASDGLAADFFGHEVGISGEVAVVGAVLEDGLGISAGAVYVYRFNPVTMLWVEEAKLTASDGVAGDAFGISVDVSGSWVIVGAEGRDDLGSASGAAYLYQYDGVGWGGEVKLMASDGGASEFYGHFVAVEGTVAVVGAPLNNGRGPNSGAGYVYRFDGANWGGEEKLMPSDGQANDWMGNTVGLDSGTIIMATGSAVMDGVQGVLFANNDVNGNGVPDVCDPPACTGDITPPGPPVGNGVVNIDDLVAVLNGFGVCPAPPASCAADITPPGGNAVVNIDDLVAVLNAFGACP